MNLTNPLEQSLSDPLMMEIYQIIINRRLLDNIPETIYVNKNKEIKIDLRKIHDLESNVDFQKFLNENQDQLPKWVFHFRNDLTKFRKKLLFLADFIYDVGGIGALRRISHHYYECTNRSIDDYALLNRY